MIEGCYFYNNSASIGGALAILSNSSSYYPVAITNSTFIDNHVSNNKDVYVGDGGGIYIESSSGPVTIENCFFSGNNCPKGSGGGIRVKTSDQLNDTTTSITFYNNQFLHNFGASGGAISVSQALTMQLNYFYNNSAVEGGGAITFDRGYPTIRNNTFEMNFSEQMGGAIHLTNEIEGEISDCNFYNNFADDGGAVYALHNTSTIITNCYFISNIANDTGGAIAVSNFKESSSNYFFLFSFFSLFIFYCSFFAS